MIHSKSFDQSMLQRNILDEQPQQQHQFFGSSSFHAQQKFVEDVEMFDIDYLITPIFDFMESHDFKPETTKDFQM